MKYRVSNTDIVNLEKVDFIEIDGKFINFYINSKMYQSVYPSEIEAKCVFQNINNHFYSTDFRLSQDLDTKNESSRKDKAFEMFYTLYDKKVDRPTARKAFLKLSLTDMGKAIKAVEKYVESTPDKKYRKNPTTWINKRSWENEVVGKSKSKGGYVKPKYIQDER